MVKNTKPRRGAKFARKSAKKFGGGRKNLKRKSGALLRSSLSGGPAGQMVRNPGNGSCSTSNWSHRIPASKQVKGMELIGAPNIGFQNRVTSVECESGQQGNRTFNVMDTGVLKSIAGRVSPGTVSSLPPWRFVVQETLDTFHMSNATSGTLEVDLYDIMLKKDVPVTQQYYPPNQTPSAVNTYTLDGDPSSYWEQGTRMGANVPANSVLSWEYNDVYNASPLDSVFFKTYYKVAKRTRIFLPQGASHKHTVLRHINQVVNTTEIQQAGGLIGLKKCTSHLLIVIRGEPLDGVNPDGDRQITTAKGLLQIVQTARYKWTWIADQAFSNYYVNTLESVTALENINPAVGGISALSVLQGT